MRIILAFIFTLLPLQVMAADIVGSASYVLGEVMVERGEEQIKLHIGDDIALGDKLLTDEGEHVEVTFLDDTIIELTGMDGSLTINEYLYDPDAPDNNKAHFGVLKGSFKYIGGMVSNGVNVTVDLDFGSIGIRGTELYRAMKDGECWIFLEHGEIEVSNAAGTVSLKPGDGTRLSAKDAPPTEVKPWGQKNIDWIKSELARP